MEADESEQTKNQAIFGDHRKSRKTEKRGCSPHQKIAVSESSRTPSPKRPARCSPTVPRQDSTGTKIAKLVKQYPDTATVQVLTELFEVFHPAESIFKHLQDGPVTPLIDNFR